MLVTLALLACAAAVVAAISMTANWLTSPPPAHHIGAIPTIRRTLAARVATSRMFCRNCRKALADESRYCSTECAEHDADMQALG